MKKSSTLLLLLLCSFLSVRSQVIDHLFESQARLSKSYQQVVSKFQALKINTQYLEELHNQKSTSLKLHLPFENGELKLDLQKVTITTSDFSVIEALPDGDRRAVRYSDGIFYQGKIEGKPNSIATISIFHDQVAAVIADEKGNIVLGAIEKNGKPTTEYTLYREKDLTIPNPFACGTSEIPIGSTKPDSGAQPNRDAAVGEPIELYFECDYKFYTDKGSNTINVINYVLSFFNNVALLYTNENIKVQVSQILVWTTQDPEAAAGLNTTGTVLPAFRDRMVTTNYIGDFAHFLSTRSLGGGIAYLLSDPCNTDKKYKTAVCAVNNTYSDFPTFSFTVEVVTHELGHNLGSNHTQWCGWTGGALDNCYTTEGGCPPGPAPTNGGTIMSYCHLVSYGINLANGFGQQPGDKIRSVIAAALCYGACRMTIAMTKTDATCGLSNGSATVTATNNTGTLTYAWSNGQTGSTLSNVAAGTYHVVVKDGSNCQVMQVVTIGNAGANMNVTLTPNVPTGFCTGSNVQITATNDPSYSYQWYKDGNIIVGASTNTYTATATGNYSVTISAGACSVTKSVQITHVTPPVAVITPAGTQTFCDNDNTQLSATGGAGYSYQWYKNAAIIIGATNQTYAVTTTGNYSVKVSAVGCESTSAASSVTINPSPAATITATGNTSFCNGGSTTLNSSTGANYSYQWYRSGSLIPGATNSSYIVNTSGNYTVITTLGTCSKTSNTINVIVWPNPIVVVTPAVSTIQKFQTQTLTGTGANTYNWASQPTFVSSTTNSIVVMPLTTTNYIIEGTDINSCKGTANVTINVIGCGNVTGITATPYSPSRVIIRWTNPNSVTTDTLQYRKVGSNTWTRIFVTGQEYELNGLDPNSNYEYNIIPLCSTTTVYLPSATNNFQTPVLQGGVYVRLFPNPLSSDGKVEIIVDKPYSLQTSVIDHLGRKVITISPKENLPGGQIIKTINVAALANGVYYIVANINGKNYNVKMLVAH